MDGLSHQDVPCLQSWPEGFGRLLGEALPPALVESIASEAQAVSRSPNFWTSRVCLGNLVML